MSGYIGDFLVGQTVRDTWASSGANGASITLGTNGTIYVYKNLDAATETTTGVTPTEDFDAKTGVHAIVIVTTDAFYEPGCDYHVCLSGAIIDSQTVNTPLFSFSIQNRYVPGLIGRGKLQAATSTTAKFPAAFSFGDDRLLGGYFAATGGAGVGQARFIDDYVNATDDGVFSPATVTLMDNTTTVEVFATPPASTSALTTVLVSNGTGPGQIALSSGTVTAGTVNDKAGYGLSSGAVSAIWNAAVSGITTVGSIGKRLVDNITGDIFGRLGAPVGASTAADIAALPNQSADALLGRNVAGGSSGGRMVKQALYVLRNKWTIVGTTRTVYATDDSTPEFTSTVTASAGAAPITGDDPA